METKPSQAPADAAAVDLALAPGPATPLAKPVLADAGSEPERKLAVVGAPPTAVDWQAKFAEETHQYVREYIRNADQKAAFFFFASTTFLAFLHSRGTSSRWLKAPLTWSLVDTLAFAAMSGLAVGAACLLLVVIPRLTGSKRGILFFNAVAEFDSAREYSDDVAGKTLAECVQTKLQHVWTLARLCRRKYHFLVAGCWIAGIGSILGLLYLWFSR